MNTRLIAAAEAVMVAAIMLAAGCGSAATSAPHAFADAQRHVASG